MNVEALLVERRLLYDATSSAGCTWFNHRELTAGEKKEKKKTPGDN